MLRQAKLIASVLLLSAPVLGRAVVVGEGRCYVVVADGASPVVRFAADELTNFLFKATGEMLPVRNRPSPGVQAIVLGTNGWSAAVGLDASCRRRDSFFIKTVDDRLYIGGNDDLAFDPGKIIAGTGHQVAEARRRISYGERATLFGVYEFLERFVGVRFYFPGELGTVVPLRRKVVVSDVDLMIEPAFLGRSVSRGLPWFDANGGPGGAKNPSGEALSWFRLRMQTDRIPFGHGQNGFRLVERFKDSHPEYFRVSKEGERDFDLKVTKDHPFYKTRQLCHTSDVWDELYRDIRCYFRGEPSSLRGFTLPGGSWGRESPFHGRYVNVMPQDAFHRCYCENCLKTFDYADPNFASEVIWSNTVSIASRLEAEGFDAVIDQMAYKPYGMPPKVAIPRNVEVMLAETGPWALCDSETFELQVRHVESWFHKLGRKVSLWTYPCKACWFTPPDAPCMAPRAFAAFFKRVSPWVKGVLCETYAERWFYQYLNFYVFSRIAWDPSTDIDELLAEHHRLLFGAAAEPMARFYETLERIWIDKVAVPNVIPETPAVREFKQPRAHRIYSEIYSDRQLEGLEALLDRAAASVSSDSLEYRRIALVRRELFDPIAIPARNYRQRQSQGKAEPISAAPETVSRCPSIVARSEIRGDQVCVFASNVTDRSVTGFVAVKGGGSIRFDLDPHGVSTRSFRPDNYDEAKVGPYELEDPLSFADGRKLRDASEWPARRAEILKIFAHEMYGVEPPRPAAVVAETIEQGGTLAGLGVREQVRMWFRSDRSGPHVDWLIVRPAMATSPVPVVVTLNYYGNHEFLTDKQVLLSDGWLANEKEGLVRITDHRTTEEQRGRLRRTDQRYTIPIETLLARGYAFMTAAYGEIAVDPVYVRDDMDRLPYERGVFELWGTRDESRTDNPTALGAWAWGLSRALDHIERADALDAKRVVVTGCSRLGKAALLAAARDERFAVCVPNQTGSGGVPLSKRFFGENVFRETEMFPHWFCKAYGKYANNEQTMKFDQHLLLACIAPRALLVQGYNSPWFDPKGEYLSCRAASAVWEFLGCAGLPDVGRPALFSTAAIGSDLGYVWRTGQHGMSGWDWNWLLNFADRALKR